MVRGAAALLTALGAALALCLAAPALPTPSGDDAAVLVPGGLVLVALGGAVVGMAVAAPVALAVVPALAGAGLVTAALAAAEVGAGATVPEALAAAALGAAFAIVLDVPALAVALPLFVAGVEIASVLGGGPSGLAVRGEAAAGDPLTLELPAWGTSGPAVALSTAEVAFLGTFAAYARRCGLRAGAAAAGMVLALVAALALSVALDADVPVLALVAAGCLVPNLDRLPGLLRATGEA